MTDNQNASTSFSYLKTEYRFLLPSMDDHISKHLVERQTFYELEMLEALGRLLVSGDVVIDVGANIGNHTVYFAGVMKCWVEAYEALPRTADILRENVARNHVDSLVSVRGVALGSSKGSIGVGHYDPSNVGGTTLLPEASGAIPVRKLDDEVTSRPVRLIKIDVEGMDLAVLEGAARVLDEDRPVVAVEAGEFDYFQTIERYMHQHGYVAVSVYNATNTYVFLPAKSKAERELILRQGFSSVIALQQGSRALAADIARSDRYIERVKRETVSLVEERLKETRQVVSSLEDAISSGSSLLRVGPISVGGADTDGLISGTIETSRRLALSEASVASLERRLQVADERARAMRDAMQRRAEEAERRALDDERRLAEEVARAEQREDALLELRKKIDRDDLAMQRMQHAVEAERDVYDRKVRRLERKIGEATQAHVLADRRVAEVEGRLRVEQKRYADKHRRVAEAHRALASVGREREQLKRRGVALRQEVEALKRGQEQIRESLSFRLGAMIVAGFKSPVRLVALIWSVPELLLSDYRRRSIEQNSDQRSSNE